MSANSGGAFSLLIESGLHAGTVQRLASGLYTLGSELEADIVLSDEDVKPIHLILELNQHGLRLEPLQGAVTLEGETVDLEPGAERHLTFPAKFALGGARVQVTAPKDAVQTRRRMRATMMAGGLAVLTVLGLQIFWPIAGGDAGDLKSLSTETSVPVMAKAAGKTSPAAVINLLEEKPDEASVDAATDEPGITLDEAAAALRTRLAAEDLADIKVQTGVGRIMARGEAAAERMDDWQDIRFWFDSTFGQEVLLVATVETAEQAMPPDLAIEAVWLGKKPYLIAGGRRFFVGNQVGDGWAIEHIGADEITFKRGDKSFSLTL